MGKIDKARPKQATPEECLRKAHALRLMAEAMPPGLAAERAEQMAEVWERRAKAGRTAIH